MYGDTTNWTDVVDLNYDNPKTRQRMIDVMQYWVREFNIDGYRADVAHAGPLDFWKNAIDSVEIYKEVLMLAESASPEMHEVGFDQTYAWPFYGVLKRVWEEQAPVRTLATQVDTTLADMPKAAARLRFTTNHDETMLVAVNVRDASKTVPVPDAYADASLTGALSGETGSGDTLTLGPYGYRLLRVE